MLSRIARTLLVAAALSAPASLLAQVSPIAESQLSRGYLGDQNSRLSGQNLAGADVYVRRAVDALSEGDFKRSLAIMRPYKMNATYTDLYITGLAHSGLGDYAAARKAYEGALHKRRNFLAAQIALAELEAGHGDKAAAITLQQELTARRDSCAGKCPDQTELANGVDRVTAALQARSVP